MIGKEKEHGEKYCTVGIWIKFATESSKELEQSIMENYKSRKDFLALVFITGKLFTACFNRGCEVHSICLLSVIYALAAGQDNCCTLSVWSPNNT